MSHTDTRPPSSPERLLSARRALRSGDPAVRVRAGASVAALWWWQQLFTKPSGSAGRAKRTRRLPTTGDGDGNQHWRKEPPIPRTGCSWPDESKETEELHGTGMAVEPAQTIGKS